LGAVRAAAKPRRQSALWRRWPVRRYCWSLLRCDFARRTGGNERTGSRDGVRTVSARRSQECNCGKIQLVNPATPAARSKSIADPSARLRVRLNQPINDGTPLTIVNARKHSHLVSCEEMRHRALQFVACCLQGRKPGGDRDITGFYRIQTARYGTLDRLSQPCEPVPGLCDRCGSRWIKRAMPRYNASMP